MSDDIQADPLTAPGESPIPTDPRRNQELAELQAAIGLGMDVEAFMETAMGRYIRMRASRELEEAQEALVEADLQSDAGRAEAREQQMKGRVAARVLTWFADMVAEAKVAEQQHAAVFDAQRHPD